MYCRRIGQPTDEVLVKNYEKELERKMDGFERLLKKQKYIAGDVCLTFWSRRIFNLRFELHSTSLSLTSTFFPMVSYSRSPGMTTLKMRRNGQMLLAGGQRSPLADRGRLSRRESLTSIQGMNSNCYNALLAR